MSKVAQACNTLPRLFERRELCYYRANTLLYWTDEGWNNDSVRFQASYLISLSFSLLPATKQKKHTNMILP